MHLSSSHPTSLSNLKKVVIKVGEPIYKACDFLLNRQRGGGGGGGGRGEGGDGEEGCWRELSNEISIEIYLCKSHTSWDALSFCRKICIG
ncbi:hypothetical protein CMV_020822 [Castanea mollissima]|uniref:Uncharacterized protein n=1 Tax=Castanea mollissima TaxID=60419 RepID=A0A8J4QQ09_9ROSI|nr:hypothetical protein CMV_020822 [Castanea mollissima]